MADDLGFSDLGCYGSEINTPNLDYLATNGVRFSRFYNTSRCCPTRAALLTGLYNQQAGIGEMTEDRLIPGYRGHLTENTVTVAEVLKEAGYRTGMVGKWHVSNTVVQPDAKAPLAWLNHQTQHPFFSPVEQYPTNRGFEKYYGNIWGVVDFFDPFSLVNGTTPVKSVPKNYYHTDALSDNGASPEDAANYGPGFDRPSKTRSGEKIAYPVDKKVLPGPQNTFASIGPRWANVANTPFRYAKAQSYEGGIRTPMIAFWPKSMSNNKGTIVHQAAHVMDFMATFTQLAQARYPALYKGRQITPMQGISLVSAIKGKKEKFMRLCSTSILRPGMFVIKAGN